MRKNWYGIKGIKFIYYNTWEDPYIEYKGKRINSHIVEDTMWDRMYEENSNREDPYKDFEKYMYEHKEDVYELLDEYLEGEQV